MVLNMNERFNFVIGKDRYIVCRFTSVQVICNQMRKTKTSKKSFDVDKDLNFIL